MTAASARSDWTTGGLLSGPSGAAGSQRTPSMRASVPEPPSSPINEHAMSPGWAGKAWGGVGGQRGEGTAAAARHAARSAVSAHDSRDAAAGGAEPLRRTGSGRLPAVGLASTMPAPRLDGSGRSLPPLPDGVTPPATVTEAAWGGRGMAGGGGGGGAAQWGGGGAEAGQAQRAIDRSAAALASRGRLPEPGSPGWGPDPQGRPSPGKLPPSAASARGITGSGRRAGVGDDDDGPDEDPATKAARSAWHEEQRRLQQLAAQRQREAEEAEAHRQAAGRRMVARDG